MIGSESEPTPEGEGEAWELAGAEMEPGGDESLIVDVTGYEGPLDLLLALARTHKVDISKISLVALAEQYLAFIAELQTLKLEVAADYLVMAAWLAYLKSRLILPRQTGDGEEADPEEMAQRLAFRLMRLDAMRDAAAQLMTRKRLGREVFPRGMPEGVKLIRDREYTAQIYDLLKAYAEQRRRTIKVGHVVAARKVWSIKEARRLLEKVLDERLGDWTQLDLCLDHYIRSEDGRTALASTFGATLELAREGRVEIRQEEPFGALYMRQREDGAEWEIVA